MTIPLSSSSPQPAVTNGTPALSAAAPVKPRRAGNRLASSPAGPPVKVSEAPSAILIIGSDGMIVPAQPVHEAHDNPHDAVEGAKNDAGTPSSVEAEAEAEADAEAEVDADTEAEAPADAEADADAETEAGADAEPEADAEAPVDTDEQPITDTGAETPADAEADAETETEAGADAEPEAETEPDAEPDPEAPVQPDADAEAVPEAEPAPELPLGATTPAGQAVPSSRRARRESELAGQAVVPPEAIATASPKPSTSASVPKLRKKLWAWLRGFLFLLVITTVVVAMGAVLPGQGKDQLKPSGTETNRAQAWLKTTSLFSQATALVATAPEAASASLLQTAAAALEVHAAALSASTPGPTPASGKTAEQTPLPEVAATPTSTVSQFVTALAANANSLLTYARSADGAISRVFASVGTSELLIATALAQEIGLPVPQSPEQAIASLFKPAATTTCDTTHAAPSGTSAAAALLAAAQGEQRAIYAYQVAGSRLSNTAFGQARTLLAVHQQRLVILNSELARQCFPQLAMVPGYALDPAYTVTPEQALAHFEEQLATVYGDLAALSEPVSVLPATANNSTPSTSGSTTPPTSVTTPRDLAIAWLLASTTAQQSWGGTVDALPGIVDRGQPNTSKSAQSKP